MDCKIFFFHARLGLSAVEQDFTGQMLFLLLNIILVT